jgi:hypothetical protein
MANIPNGKIEMALLVALATSNSLSLMSTLRHSFNEILGRVYGGQQATKVTYCVSPIYITCNWSYRLVILILRILGGSLQHNQGIGHYMFFNIFSFINDCLSNFRFQKYKDIS